MSRDKHALAILGSALHSRLSEFSVLIVGSGGIGCELLKNVVLTGFGHITLLDLDTIDISNLNRQFLFRKKDVKQPKSLVAARTAAPFNPRVHIEPLHANIKESQFDVAWFKSFDIVLNALDNLDARRHVNKMCMAANVPLVESGTAGYFGQIQPIIKDQTECFDCLPKPTPKTFPVCTIRSTPSQPIHCIVWAKSYLFPQLFGEDEDDQGELDEAEKQGENASEIQNLRREAQAFKEVRALLRSPSSLSNNQNDAARLVFDKVFTDDVKNLLAMADMWRSRAPPVPLDFETIMTTPMSNGMSELLRTNGSSDISEANVKVNASNGSNNLVETGTPVNVGRLRDQKALTLRETVDMFIASTNRLAVRLSLPKDQGGEETITFDKDDDDTLDFVCAAANLRSVVYGIMGKTRWEVKEMAGNIIPAIATTNAIIAGLIVLQALHLLRRHQPSTSTLPSTLASSVTSSTFPSKSTFSAFASPLSSRPPDLLRSVHLQHKPAIPLQPTRPTPPNPKCGVCRDTFIDLRCHTGRATLREVVTAVLKAVWRGGNGDGDEDEGTNALPEVSIYEDKRILADPDFDENLDRTLDDLNCGQGKFITVVDEEDVWGTVAIAVGLLPKTNADGPSFILPSPLPITPRKESVKIRTPSPSIGTKRRLSEIENGDEPPAKRTKTNGSANASGILGSSPMKGYKEVDGVLWVDDDDDDDIIVIQD